MDITPTITTIAAPLGFVRPDNVLPPDGRRPGLRARTVPEPVVRDDVLVQQCEIEDLDASGRRPTLAEAGFESVRLPDRRGLHDTLRAVRDRSRLDDGDVDHVRRALTGSRVRSGDGSSLLVLHVAAEGVIMRCAGPDGVSLDGLGLASAHGGAAAVHADQDVLGRPFHRMTRGLGRRLFRHESTDSANARSPLLLVNLWMPLQQPVAPLAMMDTRTLDRSRDQLRYELPTDGILDREADRAVNDIWWFRHDPAQRWCFRSRTELGDAWVFDTLSTPHGAFHVPGEDVAAAEFRRVDAAVAALAAGRRPDTVDARSTDDVATVVLQQGVAGLRAVLDDLPFPGDDPTVWTDRARAAQHAVVRKSIEVRAVALRIPSW